MHLHRIVHAAGKPFNGLTWRGDSVRNWREHNIAKVPWRWQEDSGSKVEHKRGATLGSAFWLFSQGSSVTLLTLQVSAEN